MHCLRDYYTEVLQQELNEIKEPEEIYYIEFHDETKREVYLFELQIFSSDKYNQKVVELTRILKMDFPSKSDSSFN